MQRGLVVACALAVVGAGCSGSGGGSGASSAGAVGSAAPVSSSASQWQVALGALSGGMPVPSFDDASLARWNAILAQGWSATRAQIDPVIQSEITQELTSLGGAFVVNNVKSITIDTSAPPALSSGGIPTQLIGSLPAPGSGWSASVVVEVGYAGTTSIVGIPVGVNLTLDVTIGIDQIQASVPVEFDVSNPAWPIAVGAGAPQAGLQLSLSSTSTLPVVQSLLADLQTVLEPVLLTALTIVAPEVQQLIGTSVAGVAPAQPWGLGGPGLATVTQTVDLGQLAETVDDEIQRYHIPFGTNVLAVIFSQPGYGNGVPVDYAGYGDSAIWTGHYLASQAMRWDATHDPRALAGASTVLDGLEACLDCAGPQSGLLGRCAVPVTSPQIADIRGTGTYYGLHNGVLMGALGGISRDQYIGTVLGLTYAWLRVPSLQPKAAALIGRILTYLSTNGWAASDPTSGTISAPFSTNPDVLWSIIMAANMSDRATWGVLHDQNIDLAGVFWLPIWVSSREVHDGYYKFNLMHSTAATLVSGETDPAVYRQYLKGIEVMRDVVSEHMNQWFDAVYASAVPTAAPAMGPVLAEELQHWALRPRRDQLVINSNDPTIPKALYTAIDPGSLPQWVSVYPVPIEKRVTGDFLGQTDPFQLDGGQTNPCQQEVGVDLVLPYWLGKDYGFMP